MRRTNGEMALRCAALLAAAAWSAASPAAGFAGAAADRAPFEGMSAHGGATVVLNEFLADPPPDPDGDANGDGVRSSADDEFVEIFNAGSEAADLSGWTIQDATNVRHEFDAGFVLNPGELFVVFGGGTPTGIPSGSAVASTGGLSLNNTADEVKLVGSDLSIQDARAYGPEGNEDQSIIRFPDGVGGWTLPEDAGLSWKYSPGALNGSATAVDDTSWSEVKALYRE